MNRGKIKKQAREMIKGHIWDLVKPILIIAGISMVISLLSGDYNTDPEQVNAGASLLGSILSIAIIPIEFGLLVYYVKFVRKQDYDIKELFAHYKKFWPIFCLSFLIGLFTCLWSLLLVIPGIIAALSYSQGMLIMIDGEEDAMACIKKSKAMMNGYKWDYFVFNLSFILWYLLIIVTFGIAAFYVGPYVEVADILYYEELKKVNPAKD